MMRGMKYNQFQVLPAASFVWEKGGSETSRPTLWPHQWAWPPGLLRKVQAGSPGLVRPVLAPQSLSWVEAPRDQGNCTSPVIAK